MDKKRISGVDKSIALPVVGTPRKRLDDQLKSIFSHVGLLPKAHGSSYIEAENIKIICSVYQRQQRDLAGTLVCDFKFAPFSTAEHGRYHKNEMEKDFSYQMTMALYPSIRWELYQNTRIDVFLVVLESDGYYSSLAHGITCASMALAHAKMDLLDVVVGSSGGHASTTLIDLTEKEEITVDSNFVVAMMPHINEITLVMQTGKSNWEQSCKCIELCVDACKSLLPVFDVLRK